MTMVFGDPLFLKHDPGRHPETAERLRSIYARLDQTGLTKRCAAGHYQPLTEEAIAKTHAPTVAMKVKQLAQHGGGRLDPDTVVSTDSFDVALAAAGACARCANLTK